MSWGAICKKDFVSISPLLRKATPDLHSDWNKSFCTDSYKCKVFIGVRVCLAGQELTCGLSGESNPFEAQNFDWICPP